MFGKPSPYRAETPCIEAGSSLRWELLDFMGNTLTKSRGSKKGFIMHERLYALTSTKFMERGILDMLCETRHLFSLHILARVWGWIRGPLGLTDTFLGLLATHHCIGIRDEEQKATLVAKYTKQVARILEHVKELDAILDGTQEALDAAEALDVAEYNALDEKERFFRHTLDDADYVDLLPLPDLDAVCQTEEALRFVPAKRQAQMMTWKSSDASLLELLEPPSKKKKRSD